MSSPSPFRSVSATGELRIPVALGPQSQGVDVVPGATVRRGEPVAAVPPSAPTPLAPVNATVAGITTCTLTTGREVPAVMVRPVADGPERQQPIAAEAETRLRAFLNEPPAAGELGQFTDRLRTAGVWADRWTSPDLLGQLRHALKRPVDTVLCSTLDLDDALPLQAAAAEHGIEIVAAVAAIAAATGATRGVVVVDAAATDTCRATVDRLAAQTGVRSVLVRNSYPQPNPTLVLHAVTRRRLLPGRLPSEAGTIMFDAVAGAAIGRCLLFGEPMLRVPIGVADMRDDTHHLLSVPIGAMLGDVLRASGVSTTGLEFRGGSPLRDVRLPDDAVIAGGGEVALYAVAQQPTVNPQPCIRCGWCVAGCPVHIHPAGILEAAQANDRPAGERHGLDACIECGVCTYVCPSRLPLLAGIRSLKNAPRPSG